MLALMDVDLWTDVVGLPIALALVALLVLLDVREIDPDLGQADGSAAGLRGRLATWASRRHLLVLTAVLAVALVAIVALRVRWLAA